MCRWAWPIPISQAPPPTPQNMVTSFFQKLRWRWRKCQTSSSSQTTGSRWVDEQLSSPAANLHTLIVINYKRIRGHMVKKFPCVPECWWLERLVTHGGRICLPAPHHALLSSGLLLLCQLSSSLTFMCQFASR